MSNWKIDIKATTTVNFDTAKMMRSIHNMNVKALRHAGGFGRQFVRRTIKVRASGKSSPVGTPPHTHINNSRGSYNPHGKSFRRLTPLKNSIFYGFDDASNNTVMFVGVGFKGLIDIGNAHEFGNPSYNPNGRWKKAKNFPKRPFMSPALVGISQNMSKFWENKLK